MSLKKLISRYTSYNLWANDKMIQWLETLKETIIYQETPSSFSTIAQTLQHMANAQLFWITIISEADVPKDGDATRSDTCKSIFNALHNGSQQLIDTCEPYSEEDMLKQLSSTDMVQSRYDFILHLVNHNTYHRGQIVTMSHCLGVAGDIPAMDYEAFLWSDGRITEA